jgi:hypothetical protein
MPGYIDELKKSANDRRTILCFGIDPKLERINIGTATGAVQERIETRSLR